MKNVFSIFYYGLLISVAIILCIKSLTNVMRTTPTEVTAESIKSDSTRVISDTIKADTVKVTISTDTTKMLSESTQLHLNDSLKVDTSNSSTKKISRLVQFWRNSVDTIGDTEITERVLFMFRQPFCKDCCLIGSNINHHYNTKTSHHTTVRVVSDDYRTELCHKLNLLRIDYSIKYRRIEIKSNDYVFKLMPVDSTNEKRISSESFHGLFNNSKDCSGEYVALCKIIRKKI